MTTIYAVVTLTKPYTQFSCHVYSKQTSNIDVMRAYKEEIKRKHTDATQVILTSRERAKAIKSDYYHWFREYEKTNYDKTKRKWAKVSIDAYKEIMEER